MNIIFVVEPTHTHIVGRYNKLLLIERLYCGITETKQSDLELLASSLHNHSGNLEL